MLKALIFDIDGVIAETESIYYKAFQKAFSPYNIDMSPDYHRSLIGYSIRENIIKIRKDFNIDVDVEQYIKKQNDEYLSFIERTPLEANPGFEEILIWANGKNIPMGVCSSSKRNLAEKVLSGVFEKISIDEPFFEFFDAIVAGDDGFRKKPYPDLYIETVRRLGQEPSECVTIEDSKCGITSARAAGLRTVGLFTPYNSPAELAEADKIVSTLNDIIAENFWGWFE